MKNIHKCKQIKVVHFRNARLKRTNEVFKMNTETINLVQQYKYLGILLDEHFKFEVCDDIWRESFSITYI